jgi:hypothetical protein
MRQQTRSSKEPAEKVVQDIRRATRKHYSAEEKIRIVLEGLRGEDSIAELCSPRGDRAKSVLSLVERLPGGWQEAPGWRYGPGRNLGRGHRPAARVGEHGTSARATR